MIYEHEPLWIIAVVIVSAISTLMAVLTKGLRKGRARASARMSRARPTPSHPSPRLGECKGREGEGEEEEEMV